MMDNILIRSAQPNELPQVLDLIDTAFTHYTETPDEANGRSHVELFTAVYARADLDFDLLIVAEDTTTGQLVSMASFLPKPARLGHRDLNGVILSPVGTLPEYRGRGIAESVLRFGLQLAREKGYAFSCVLGHPHYYPRVGYVPAFPWYRLSQALPELPEPMEPSVLSELPDVPETQKLGDWFVEARPFAAADLPALVEIYDREASAFPLRPARSLAWWETELAHLGAPGRCFSDLQVFMQNGEVVGYASLGEEADKLLLHEAYVAAPTAAPDVLNAIYALAAARGKTALDAKFPALASIGLHLKLQGATETAHAPSAWMFQVLNWESWLEAYAIHTGLQLLLQYEDEALYIDGDLTPAAHPTAAALTQLTLGLFTPDDLQTAGLLTVATPHRAQLRQLFPKRAPYFNLAESLF